MIVHTCLSKKYILSSEEEEILKRATAILDDLYKCSQEDGELENDFQEARNGLDYILEKAEFDGECSYWKEEIPEDEV